MATTTITGTINGVNNAALANKWITFRLVQLGTDSVATATVAQSVDSVQTDANGDFSIGVWNNGDSGKPSVLEITIDGSKAESVIIPTGTATIELWDLIENYQADGSTSEQVPTVSDLFLRKSNNLSDLGSATTSRTNLGVAIGSNVQAHSAVLDATTASFTAADESKLSGIEALAEVNDPTTVLDADIGSTVQAHSAILDATTASFTTAKDTAISTNTSDISVITSDALSTLQGRRSVMDVKAGSAASFLSIPSGASVNIGTGNFSVFWWGKLPSTSNTNTQSIIRKISGADGFEVYYQGSAGGPYGRVTSYLGGEGYDLTAGSFNDDLWHFFVLTYDRATTLSFYVDGALTETNTLANATNEDTTTDLEFLGGGGLGVTLASLTNYVGLTKDLITPAEVALMAKDPEHALQLSDLAACVAVPQKSTYLDKSANAANVSLTGSLIYNGYEPKSPESTVIVSDASDLSGTLLSTVVYFIDGIIDMGSQSIEVPAGGLSLAGSTFDVCQLTSSAVGYTMFTSPVGGSGNLLGKDLGFETSGATSQVFDLVSATGFDAFEFARINFNNCTSLGTVDNYRQGLEEGTGRFGGTPTLTLKGAWAGGYRITTSIVRSLSAGMTTPLFSAGVGFSMASRFLTDINCDLPALAAFCDFNVANFPNPSTVQVQGAIITRDGAFNAEDTNIFSGDLLASSLPSQWRNSVGLPNTFIGAAMNTTVEVETTLVTDGVPVDIAGTFAPSDEQHFDEPANGQLRHLGSQPTEFTVNFDFVIEGTSGDTYDIQLWKDNGVAAAVFDQSRVVNNLQGARNVAYFSGMSTVTLNQNDFVYWRVANIGATNNCTLELDSQWRVSER